MMMMMMMIIIFGYTSVDFFFMDIPFLMGGTIQK
jgi:hypothetical protein